MNDTQITKEQLTAAKAQLDTITDWLRWTTSQLNQADVFFGHGTDNPWDESMALVLQALHLPFDLPELLYQSKITTEEKDQICEFIEKRINHRKPLAYITNQAYFCELPFYVDERTLVPRSPIGELIQNQFAGLIDPDQVHSILDLCTGSGCIAIASAYAFPDAMVAASDLSEDALEVAAINVEQHQLEERVCLYHGDLFEQIPQQQFDIVVSNPPYVDAEDLADMPQEFHQEPEMGLGSGIDGLEITKKILQQAHHYLSDNGILIVEVGNSWPALQETYPELEFCWLEFEKGGDGVFMLTKNQLEELNRQG